VATQFVASRIVLSSTELVGWCVSFPDKRDLNVNYISDIQGIVS
jgi:hypothetical protein